MQIIQSNLEQNIIEIELNFKEKMDILEMQCKELMNCYDPQSSKFCTLFWFFIFCSLKSFN